MIAALSDSIPCFVSLSRGVLIDTAPDGRGTYSGETLAEELAGKVA